jgi:hypothetical protein
VRHLFAVSLLPLIIGTSAVAASAPKESWGKAGITLKQYRQDALDCGLKGYYTDISQTDDAKAFVSASKQLDAITTGSFAPITVESNATGPDTTNAVQQMAQYANQQQHVVDSVRADSRFHSIKQTLTANTEQCLASRGYSKFALTADQRHAISKLKAGSDQRREYLYDLASDPTVLAAQKVSVSASR